MMMPMDIGIEAHGFAIHGDLLDQARPHESVQVVIDRGARRPRVHAVDGLADLVRGGVPGMREALQYGIALGRTPQPGAPERAGNVSLWIEQRPRLE
jgi:hypothetical protein